MFCEEHNHDWRYILSKSGVRSRKCSLRIFLIIVLQDVMFNSSVLKYIKHFLDYYKYHYQEIQKISE